MCARNDTVVIPLDATINGNSSGFNRTESLFWDHFDYGTIYSSASCLSTKEILQYSSNWDGKSALLLNTSSDELIGASGYYMNADTNPDIPNEEKPDYDRKWCCVKIAHPMSSSWYCAHNYGTSAGCSSQCIDVVGAGYTLGLQIFRNVLFNSIGTVSPWEEE